MNTTARERDAGAQRSRSVKARASNTQGARQIMASKISRIVGERASHWMLRYCKDVGRLPSAGGSAREGLDFDPAPPVRGARIHPVLQRARVGSGRGPAKPLRDLQTYPASQRS